MHPTVPNQTQVGRGTPAGLQCLSDPRWRCERAEAVIRWFGGRGDGRHGRRECRNDGGHPLNPAGGQRPWRCQQGRSTWCISSVNSCPSGSPSSWTTGDPSIWSLASRLSGTSQTMSVSSPSQHPPLLPTSATTRRYPFAEILADYSPHCCPGA